MAHDRRFMIREHAGRRRQIAGVVDRDAQQPANGVLAGGDAVEVASRLASPDRNRVENLALRLFTEKMTWE